MVASDSWPSHSCTVRTSIPARSQRVALGYYSPKARSIVESLNIMLQAG